MIALSQIISQPEERVLRHNLQIFHKIKYQNKVVSQVVFLSSDACKESELKMKWNWRQVNVY